MIERQTEHMARLVDDLLDVTRIARGKMELRRSHVDLREIILRAADDYRVLTDQRGLALRVTVPDAAVWVEADAARVTQVAGNLLHNAAKFTQRGGEVALGLAVADGAAVISVRDTGVGIDPDLVPQLFDAFVQGQQTLARTEGGLGLGLALVKGITQLHGGTVSAKSAGIGMGAEFTVRLRLASSPAETSPPTLAPVRGTRRKVLVVEDNRDAADSLKELIEMLGHAAEVAYGGRTAVEKARASRPDVVLCDIGLPGMSGYEVAQAIRADGTNGARLIAVTGYTQAEDVKRAIEAGFDGHVAKPPEIAQIERLLS